MHKIDGAGHVNGSWVNEDVALSRPPTEITADIMNALQFEIINVIEGAGFTLNKPTNTQLLSAIQALIKGGDYKDSVRFTTTANIVLSGLGTQAGGDWGAALTAGDRILAKNQTAGAENGIWIVAAGAWTRATDADTNAELTGSSIIPVDFGNTLADTVWQLITDNPVIGTTALTFVQIPSQFASSAEAQGLALLTKALSPGGLAAALQGANQSLAGSGYQKLPGGLILQWGELSLTDITERSIAITFPITFPNAVRQVITGFDLGSWSIQSGANVYGQASAVTASGFNYYLQMMAANSGTGTFKATYFAIGN